MRRSALLVIGLGVLLSASTAPADPGHPFDPFDPVDLGRLRRTTPRASLDRDAGGLVVGIPSGRAWGIETALLPLEGTSRVTLVLSVDGPDVAEAFVRVANDARADARSR